MDIYSVHKVIENSQTGESLSIERATAKLNDYFTELLIRRKAFIALRQALKKEYASKSEMLDEIDEIVDRAEDDIIMKFGRLMNDDCSSTSS